MDGGHVRTRTASSGWCPPAAPPFPDLFGGSVDSLDSAVALGDCGSAVFAHGEARRRRYRTIRTVGAGSEAVVRAALCLDDHRPYALKVVTKAPAPPGSPHARSPSYEAALAQRDKLGDDLRRKFDAVACLKHPNLPAMVEHFETHDKCYTVMELCAMDLTHWVHSRGRPTEAQLRTILTAVLRALAFLHSKGVAHRDLKPTNVLLRSPDDLSTLCLTDFNGIHVGPAVPIAKPGMSTLVGTPFYLAPEVLRGISYSAKVDCWAAGVLAFELACGTSPFGDSGNFAELYARIGASRWSFPPGDYSPELRDFVACMLRTDPNSRPSADEALRHPFLSPARPALRRANSGHAVAFVDGELRLLAAPSPALGPTRRTGLGTMDRVRRFLGKAPTA
ncbi:kinase-like domain-containing protein [Hyaloraphidium curvatum]|nr:kinase-like domain-containing protein [Hyaloraphidium curvatum]